jgi:hypothetical protein
MRSMLGLVLGSVATRGYEKQTTPCLEERRGIIIEQVGDGQP